MDDAVINLLLAAAKTAQQLAYAPYSAYPVGAAILGGNGTIYAGCNVENVSYPAGICAERCAICLMVMGSCYEITGLAVVTRDAGTPCGLCLQTLNEFTKNPAEMSIVVFGSNSGERTSYTLAELLPHGFRSFEVSKHAERPGESE